MRSMILATALAMALPFAPAFAQTGTAAAATQSSAPPQSAATQEYSQAMERMHLEMTKMKPTGDATRDFVEMMIPHHQGAIDMARIVLKHTRDKGIRDLAEEIVEKQQEEVEELQSWLSKHPAPAQTGAQ